MLHVRRYEHPVGQVGGAVARKRVRTIDKVAEGISMSMAGSKSKLSRCWKTIGTTSVQRSERQCGSLFVRDKSSNCVTLTVKSTKLCRTLVKKIGCVSHIPCLILFSQKRQGVKKGAARAFSPQRKTASTTPAVFAG